MLFSPPLLACFVGTAHNYKIKALVFMAMTWEVSSFIMSFERMPEKSTLDRSSLLHWLNLVPMH